MKKKNLWQRIFGVYNPYREIDHLPKWIDVYSVISDHPNFYFYKKGKNWFYKIRVENFKSGSQKVRVWRKLRKKNLPN